MKAGWKPRISRTKFGWSVDWWEGGKHRQRRFKDAGSADEFAEELQDTRAALAAAEKKARAIARENARRGDTVVQLMNLSAEEKAAVAAAIATLRAAGGRTEDLQEAAREWAEGHLASGAATVAEVMEAHLRELKTLGRSRDTIRQRRFLCERLVEHVGADARFAALGRPAISKWISTAPPGSRTHYFTAASVLCRWGWSHGYCRNFAMEGMSRPDSRPRPEPEILTPKQVRALLETARVVDAGMVPYLALGLFGGLRPKSELVHLQWEDIDWEEKKIFVTIETSKKTHRARPIPMADCLAAWLKLTPKKLRTGPAAPFSRWNYRKIQEMAGVHIGRDVMRHTRVSYRLAEIRNPAIVSHENGHSLAVMQMHYANLRLKDAEVREFWGIVPSLKV